MERNALNFIVEANIPFVVGQLEPFGNVRYLQPEEITPNQMKDCDALVTRTRTRCNSSLLEGSRCQMIASATIGLDHIDLDYCKQRGITVANAPGCNAPAVAQYVLASIIASFGEESLSGMTLGIVGVGHVGKIVEMWARQLGMDVMLCDPPRARREGQQKFSTLDEIARKADIITFHTPHTTTGQDATHHMADRHFFASLKRRSMIINSARGPIVDTPALIEAIDSQRVGRCVIDCWENEPDISHVLLEKAFIATPHIAGYSREGKIRATQMALEAVGQHFGFTPGPMNETVPAGPREKVDARLIADSYNPLTDTEALRSDPSRFEELRNHYNLRAEV